MEEMNAKTDPHFQKKSTREYEFHAAAAEITILDRADTLFGISARDESTPIRWRGMDLYGTHVMWAAIPARSFTSA